MNYHIISQTGHSTTNFTDFSFSSYSTNPLLPSKIAEVQTVFKELNFKKEAILEISFDILNEAFLQGKTDICISKTGDNELLIYTFSDGDYKNIIIDADADIEYLYIPMDRTHTFNEHFSFIMNDFSPKQLAEKL